MYFIVLLLVLLPSVGASSTACALDRSPYSRRAQGESTAQALTILISTNIPEADQPAMISSVNATHYRYPFPFRAIYQQVELPREPIA
jgi:hypothetical protein